jgi:pantothenate kinase
MIVNTNTALLVSDLFVNMFSSSNAALSDVLTAIIPNLSLGADIYNAAMRKAASGMSIKSAVGEAIGSDDDGGLGGGSSGGGQVAALLALLQMLQQQRGDASE